MEIDLRVGDSLQILKELEENSIDSVVTDPPYGLSFMGKKWDYDVPTTELWKEVIRVLKPGGHLLSFSSSRTYHRMAVAVEDAGFEIRDQIMWVYGSGFPKSHNIGKQLQKRADGGNLRDRHPENKGIGDTNGHFATSKARDIELTDDLATQYGGWGTALKPAHEPIVLARKPFKGTVVDNVIKHGTGGINIDKSRVGNEKIKINSIMAGNKFRELRGDKADQLKKARENFVPQINEGRFPANFIHDGSDEVLEKFPQTASWGKQKETKFYESDSSFEWNPMAANTHRPDNTYGDKGSASRFFYCAKVSKSERNVGCEDFDEKISKDNSNRKLGSDFDTVRTQTGKNNHPTVKPVKLMSYLVNLITPEKGVVLDPFMGSGSTGMACKQEGFNFIGIELDEDYVNIAKARIDGWK